MGTPNPTASHGAYSCTKDKLQGLSEGEERDVVQWERPRDVRETDLRADSGKPCQNAFLLVREKTTKRR